MRVCGCVHFRGRSSGEGVSTRAPERERYVTAVIVSQSVCYIFAVQTVLMFPINPLTPNDPYRSRTAPLTSKVAFYIFIQQI